MLVALGIVTIYSVTGIVNLAQGEYSMLGAMLASPSTSWGLPLALAFLAAVSAPSHHRRADRAADGQPGPSASPITLIMITVGVAIAVRGSRCCSGAPRRYSLPAFTRGAPLQDPGAAVSRQRMWIMGTGLLVLLLLYYLFRVHAAGQGGARLRHQPPDGRADGHQPQPDVGAAYALSAALGALGGIVIAPLTLVSYDMGLMLGLKASWWPSSAAWSACRGR